MFDVRFGVFVPIRLHQVSFVPICCIRFALFIFSRYMCQVKMRILILVPYIYIIVKA